MLNRITSQFKIYGISAGLNPAPAPTPAPTPAKMDAITGKDVTTAYAVGPTVQDLRQERNCPLGYYQVFLFLDIDFNVRFAAEQISLSLLAVNKLNNSSVSFVG